MQVELEIPKATEAERAVIGNLMMDASRLRMCKRAGVEPGDFFDLSSRSIYVQMIKHADAHLKEFDPVSLIRYLRESGELELVGGPVMIAEMFENVPRYFHDETFLRHVEAVREAGRKRALLIRASKIESDINDGERTALEIASDLKRLAEDFRPADYAAVTLPELVQDSINRLTKRQFEPARGIRLGHSEFDDLVGGLHPGHLCVLAARTRIGKTMLAVQWTTNVMKEGRGALFFSYEMSSEEIIDRAIKIDARISTRNWRAGMLSAEEYPRWKEATDWLAGAPLHLRDRIPPKFPTLADEARHVTSRADIGLIVVDYVGMLSMDRRYDSRVAELSEITRGLKLLARELGVPVLCLAQLNRSIEKRADGEPLLSDLRDSGSIEMDADQVIIITPGELINDRLEERRLHLEKNRHGSPGKVDMFFDRTVGCFDW